VACRWVLAVGLQVSWLNFHVMAPSSKIAKLPHSLYENAGKLALEAIESMAGKPLKGRVRLMPWWKCDPLRKRMGNRSLDQTLLRT
jgi:hypothetical protein